MNPLLVLQLSRFGHVYLDGVVFAGTGRPSAEEYPNDGVGDGLPNPFGAEVNLASRTHGDADTLAAAGVLEESLWSRKTNPAILTPGQNSSDGMALAAGFRLMQWQVRPDQNRLVGNGSDIRLTPRAMEVLVCLAENAGQMVTRQDFSERVWSPAIVTDDALTRCISELRRKLGDQASRPRFIETIPKRGYRLVAPVRAIDETAPTRGKDRDESFRSGSATAKWPITPTVLLGILVLVGLASIAGRLWLGLESPATEPDQSIAVLPFENLTTDVHNPFAEGLHHELLTRLSNIADLEVISRTSVKQYRDSNQSIPEIARELNVAWVMEGAVQQVGNEILLNAQLINAASDMHAWARSYRRELTAENLFAIQTEIVDDIATAMQARLSPDEQQRVGRVPTDNLPAYELVIRGATLLGQRTESAMRQAADLFGQAIDLDPGYADAWAQLASAQTLLAYYGHEDAEPTLSGARDNAQTALKLEPELPMAHMVLGVVHMHLDHNGPAALQALGKAHALSSEYVGWLAWMQAVAGDLDQALKLTGEQVRTSPSSPSVHMSMAFLLLADRQPDAAHEHARKARALSPGYALAWLLEGQALLVQGLHREAIAAIEAALVHASNDSKPEYQGWLAAAHARAGETQRAQELIDRIRESDEAYALGIAQVGLGTFEGAIEALGHNG
ncbi:MAG: winged helix-turn-helix domain-containing tetratricopeptide repeat protein, partial [Wenzhouxiangella sp.]